MNGKDKIVAHQISSPSWDGVRKIYKKLSEEFHTLSNAFDITIDPETKIYLDHLIIAIDEIDNCIDELPTKKLRDEITEGLVNYLSDNAEHWNHSQSNNSFSTKIENLKRVVQNQNVEAQFVDAAETIFHNTEIKRHTNNIDDLIEFISQEGKATALLPLSILKIKPEVPFGMFFTNLCIIMGIADLVFDAREDFRKGFIVVKPSFELYRKLIHIVIRDGISLLISIPKKLKFLVYCFKFTLALMRS